ncbi:Carbohydrate sulfotransferase 15 [Bulinus truncatus]|nr:Carbohydrate sulfotransferase 15 [Bulinus truncatus]
MLDLKPLTFIDPDNMTYDNLQEFPCSQPMEQLRDLGPYDSEDVMCYPRPSYIDSYQSPCYTERRSSVDNTLQFKCLPYFHILGFDKCGTTDLYNRLTFHPQIIRNFGALGKEIYFWSWSRYGIRYTNRTTKWRLWDYKNYFYNMTAQIKTTLAERKIQLITGDATPMDVWEFRGWPSDPQNKGLLEPRFLSPHAMRHTYRNPKFIILVRNPVDRLYSDYLFLGRGFSPEKFAVDVPIAVAMMTDCLRNQSVRQCFYSDDMYVTLPMRIHISCYSVFLREWFSVFSKKHFLVIQTEDYHNNTREYLRKVFDFLQISPLSDSELEKIVQEEIKYQTPIKKTIGPMLPETRAILEEFFARFNEDLASLMGDSRFLWRDA